MNANRYRVAVVGGGLAGLSAALHLSRAGLAVDLFEKSRSTGGRARTMNQSGFLMNLGAHALYANGACRRFLDELEIPFTGARPDFAFRFLEQGRELALPVSTLALLTHRGYSVREKWEVTRVLLAVLRSDPKAAAGVSMQAWLESRCRSPRVQLLLEGLFRLGTYAADLDVLSADAGIAQFQVGQGGVFYLDGGWQSLIDGLRAALQASGATLKSGAGVEALVRSEADGRIELRLNAGAAEAERYDSVLLACDPANAARLAADLNVRVPEPGGAVRAACLDVGLSELTVDRGLVLDFDRRLYFSVHSKAAQLLSKERQASDGVRGAMIHLIKYLRRNEDQKAGSPRDELEMLLDNLQPGWRDRLVAEQYMPRIAVMYDLPDYRRGGLIGRAPVDIGAAQGVFLAGDWVGDEGLLSDAAMASARAAAGRILKRSRAGSADAAGTAARREPARLIAAAEPAGR